MDKIIDLVVEDKKLATALKALNKKYDCDLSSKTSSISIQYTKQLSDSVFDGFYFIEIKVYTNSTLEYSCITIRDCDKSYVSGRHHKINSLKDIEDIVNKEIAESISRRIEVLKYQLSLLKEK